MKRNPGARSVILFWAMMVLPLSAQDAMVPEIGERKLSEFGRESYPPVTSEITPFMEALDKKVDGGEAIYQSMQDLMPHTSPLKGLGKQPLTGFQTLHHVLSAKSFFDQNVSTTWKDRRAKELGIQRDSPQLLAAWKEEVTQRGAIPREMIAGRESSLISFPKQWWSPDPRMARPTSKTRSQGNDDYFAMCRIVSLAPEWYPDGLIRLSIDLSKFPAEKAKVVRPVSFDGITSPLWVQRPPSRPAATGSGALETLTVGSFRLSDVDPDIAAYIITPTLEKALADCQPQGVSVNEYSVDLTKVSKDRLLGAQQALIVRDVRKARAEANQRFNQATKPLEIIAMKKKGERSEDGLGPDWKGEMEAWGSAGKVEHRGQRFPSERFQREAQASSEARKAIDVAAAELMKTSKDPGVLSLVSHLGDGSEHGPYYHALLGRLEGRGDPIPEAEGTRNATLREDLIGQLNTPVVAGHPELAPRAHALLDKEKNHEVRLALLTHADPDKELPEVFAKVVESMQADPNLVANAAARIAEHHPGHLERAAAHLADHPAQTRELFIKSIERVSTEQAQKARAALEKK